LIHGGAFNFGCDLDLVGGGAEVDIEPTEESLLAEEMES
jgi:hypothetical protein